MVLNGLILLGLGKKQSFVGVDRVDDKIKKRLKATLHS
jgi:hypothetical protein